MRAQPALRIRKPSRGWKMKRLLRDRTPPRGNPQRSDPSPSAKGAASLFRQRRPSAGLGPFGRRLRQPPPRIPYAARSEIQFSWTFGKWRGSAWSRGARPPRVPSGAPRARHGEVSPAFRRIFFVPGPRGRVPAHSRASALPETMRPALGETKARIQKLSAIGIRFIFLRLFFKKPSHGMNPSAGRRHGSGKEA